MMNSSDSVVRHYLDSLLLDLTMPEPESKVADVADYFGKDSIISGQRLVPCFDPFIFMEVGTGLSKSQHWLVALLILQLCGSLPTGRLKSYCLRQCQTLFNNGHLAAP